MFYSASTLQLSHNACKQGHLIQLFFRALRTIQTGKGHSESRKLLFIEKRRQIRDVRRVLSQCQRDLLSSLAMLLNKITSFPFGHFITEMMIAWLIYSLAKEQTKMFSWLYHILALLCRQRNGCCHVSLFL